MPFKKDAVKGHQQNNDLHQHIGRLQGRTGLLGGNQALV